MTPIGAVTAVPDNTTPAAVPPAPAAARPSADFRAALAAEAPASEGGASLRAPRTRAPETTGEAFEAAMLVPFVAAMLPPDDSEIWGGTGGAMWRGLFADALASDVARSGGIGIARLVDSTVAARTEPAATDPVHTPTAGDTA